jgi:hypothetical protein
VPGAPTGKALADRAPMRSANRGQRSPVRLRRGVVNVLLSVFALSLGDGWLLYLLAGRVHVHVLV